MHSKELLGRKLGMTQVFDANGEARGVTVVEAGPCRRHADEDAREGRLRRRSRSASATRKQRQQAAARAT